MGTAIVWGIFLLLIILDVYNDTMNKNKKDLHLIQSVIVFIWLMLVGLFASEVIEPLAYFTGFYRIEFIGIITSSYILLRFAIFDIAYNLWNANPIIYYGVNSFYAKTMNWLSKKIIGFNYIVLAARLVALAFSELIIENIFKINW